MHVKWHGSALCPDRLRARDSAGPTVPRLTALSDAINLLSPQRIESGLMKATIEEVDAIIETFAADVDGIPVGDIETLPHRSVSPSAGK